MAFPAQDPYVLKASCKTYYETIRKTYRMNQEDNLQKKEDMIAARRRQRRRRLIKSRANVLQTEEERAIWTTVTVDMVSDEEDAILDGKPVWIVRPPERSTELSELCGVLQKRLDANQKYVLTHHARVGAERIDH
ncbi:hypothetical protein AAFF_G00259020 [Aldrovandia affinis]|uniref:Uncharacterized protein n=1 Tax=Aldrovandia affinis TaxID=143900 RepID=A0AAD7STP3_9TELE|nr:hypothetical protein AAFF_G00259020 [Aldrovandia affinis]